MSHGHRTAASAARPSGDRLHSPDSSGLPDWRRLDPERRLSLVARALRANDGFIDQFPLAL